MRKATRSVIAGNPPADAAQPSGINGIIVTVAMNEKQEPRAPRIPNFLFQNPKNKSAPKQPFRNSQKPSGPTDAENRVHPKNKRTVADIGNQCLRLVLKPLLIAEE